MADDKVYLGDGMPIKLVDLGDGGAGGYALATTAEITAELTTLETEMGAVTETAPATDTASSGLNGRLQRIAQRLTSIIALIPAALGQGTMAQSLRVVLASDQSAVAVTANPATGTRVSSAAYEASKIIKNSPGTLITVFGYNSGAAQFIQLHDSTTLPSDAVAPAAVFTVPATSNFSLDIPLTGIPFTTGIVVCNSSTGPTKTIGAADCYFTAVRI